MSHVIDSNSDALLIVDLQPTFFPKDPHVPGSGELPAPTAPDILDPINSLLGRFDHIIATRDAHPADHLSFASQFEGKQPFDTLALEDLDSLQTRPGVDPIDTSRLGNYLQRVGSQILWPDHGRRDTPGGKLHPALDTGPVESVILKGEDRYYDSYSAFFDNGHFTKTLLDQALRSRRIKRLFISGIALDFCVQYSAIDALSLDYEVVVLEDCCAAIDQPEGTASEAWQKMVKRGAVRAHSADLTTASH